MFQTETIVQIGCWGSYGDERCASAKAKEVENRLAVLSVKLSVCKFFLQIMY